MLRRRRRSKLPRVDLTKVKDAQDDPSTDGGVGRTFAGRREFVTCERELSCVRLFSIKRQVRIRSQTIASHDIPKLMNMSQATEETGTGAAYRLRGRTAAGLATAMSDSVSASPPCLSQCVRGMPFSVADASPASCDTPPHQRERNRDRRRIPRMIIVKNATYRAYAQSSVGLHSNGYVHGTDNPFGLRLLAVRFECQGRQ